tara:strand:+ start:468 stop:1073 length:606 start_codon:yes stop_codon:yes gene_type:complete
MSIKLATVDNDVVEIKDNKVVGPNSKFDGMDVKTNADIMKIFGIKPKVNMKDYMKFGDQGEQQLYLDAVKVFRGEIKGPRAEQIMNAVQGEFGPNIMDKIRQDALKGSPTMNKLFPTLQNMSQRFPEAKQVPQPFYPGDNMPKMPNIPAGPNMMPGAITPNFRPGVDPMGMPQRNITPGNMTMGPKNLNRMLMANMMGLLS